MFGMHSSLELIFYASLGLLLAAWIVSRRRVFGPRSKPQNAIAFSDKSFLIKPYLQLGDQPALQSMESVELLWHTPDDKRRWQVQLKVQGDADWRQPVSVDGNAANIDKMGKHLRFQATLENIPPGAAFDYRLLADRAIAFSASGKARSGAEQPFTVVVAGDLGTANEGDMQPVACRIDAAQPDFMVLPGDVSYDHGRISEYLENVFPVYNHNKRMPAKGAPILRSRIVMANPGNHDMAIPHPTEKRDFTRFSDLLGYFIFWSLPMNGPQRNGPVNCPQLEGDEKALRKFLAAAGERFPRTGCYSFDWGNSHWTMLDSNAYMNWSDKNLVTWLENDLSTARYATWRFVVFHHPPFTSDVGDHSKEQRMRILAPLFERWQVDVVFNGHNHCYERSRPIRFSPDDPKAVVPLNSEDCQVPGAFKIDEQYDGVDHKTPDGVIYVVDGAGGAKLYAVTHPKDLQPYSQVYDQSQHSFTYISINRKRLVAVQVGADGAEIDRYVIDKT